MSERYPELALYIDGQWHPAGARATLPVINPATGDSLADLPCASDADIDEAVRAAAKGFAVWRAVAPIERGRLLRRAADMILERREHIAHLITWELGKPLAESRMEVDTAAAMFEWNGEEARRAYGRVIPARNPDIRQFAIPEPIGPVAAFSAWNAPAITPSRKISSALAAGCSLIMKPAEETPATALAIAAILHEAGLPAGVLNMVFGDAPRISARLMAAPEIRGVTFTGSTAVGKILAADAVRSMKRMTLELGGHAPVLIFADADIDRVVAGAVTAKYRNSGQVCTSPTRFLVQRPICDAFAEKFIAAVRMLRLGDGFDPDTKMGPLATERRLAAMDRFAEDARQRGIAIPVGGQRVERPGYFWQPTVLGPTTDDDCLAATVEPFGPLALIRPFEDVDEALSVANRLPFGLAAYAMTDNAALADRVARGIESGNVILNHWQASSPETPFGGVKESGFGTEGGLEGLRAFQNLKYISRA